MKHIILILGFLWISFPGIERGYFTAASYTGPAFTRGTQGEDTLRYVYVGAEACASKCHNSKELGFQYDRWMESPHSKAYTSLSTERAILYANNAGIAEIPGKSLTCLKCHVAASGVDIASIGVTYRAEDGVTCESCHKGEFIRKTFLPKEADCLKCHNNSVHEVAAFDFKEGCQKISHPRPAKQK